MMNTFVAMASADVNPVVGISTPSGYDEEHSAVAAADEISNIAGMPMGTAKSRISRARFKLRDFLLEQPELLPVRLAS